MDSVIVLGFGLLILVLAALGIWSLRRPYDRSASVAATERLLAEQRADIAALDDETRHHDPKDEE